MTISELHTAVQCCTSNESKWDKTCGKCPFNEPITNFQLGTKCIDKLMIALSQYLPNEDGGDK